MDANKITRLKQRMKNKEFAMDAQFVKAKAKECGADLAGIAPAERFADFPLQHNPLSIFPNARSVIVLANQIGRGVLRGVKDGVFYGAFEEMAHRGLRDVVQPVMLWRFIRILEDSGYEAIPVSNHFSWSNIDDVDPDEMGQDFIDVNTSAYGKPKGSWSRPVAPGKAAPDVLPPMRLLGFCAGLGEIGHSGLLLTKEFGPRQKLTAVITDAELEPDPLFEGKICDRCMECVRHCPAAAISGVKTHKARVAGRDLEWGGFDFGKCSTGFYGGGENAVNPFAVDDRAKEYFNSQPYTKHSGMPVDGQRGCVSACLAHLEEKGVLSRKYKSVFKM
jgi:ferredoxin